MNHPIHTAIDGTAVAGVAANMLGMLPESVAHFTTYATAVWVLIRLYETATVRSLLKRLRTWLYG